MISKKIELASDINITVTIRELTINDIISVIETVNAQPDFDINDLKLDIHTFIKHKDLLIYLFEAQCEFSDGSSVADLGLSDVIQLIGAFKEVNASFLELATQMPDAVT